MNPDISREVVINGVRVSGEVIPMIIAAFTYPETNKWYRFERVGDVIHVETKCVIPDMEGMDHPV